MTPHELNLHIVEYGQKLKREGDQDHVVAYLTAYYHRVKKMPDLEKKLESNKPKQKARQSDEEMFARLMRD